MIRGALVGLARDLSVVAVFALVAVPTAACVMALSTADVDRQRAIERNAAWIYRSDAAPAADQLLAKEIYCLAWRTQTENGVDAGDAGIVCVPEGGQ